jgi:hypothetical protein
VVRAVPLYKDGLVITLRLNSSALCDLGMNCAPEYPLALVSRLERGL